MERRAWKEPLEDTLIVEDLALAPQRELRIVDGKGLLVAVGSGEVWITQEGDRRDHFVAAGRGFRLDRDGVALVMGLGRTRLTLSAPSQAERRWHVGSRR